MIFTSPRYPGLFYRRFRGATLVPYPATVGRLLIWASDFDTDEFASVNSYLIGSLYGHTHFDATGYFQIP